jgi:circadian clock protein KaiB
MSADEITARFEAAAGKATPGTYVLRLYTVGATPRSLRAIHNLKEICEQELAGRYTLEVIDVTKHPRLMAEEQIVAIPTLIKELPAPIARLVGDLSDREAVLLGLDLRPRRG